MVYKSVVYLPIKIFVSLPSLAMTAIAAFWLWTAEESMADVDVDDVWIDHGPEIAMAMMAVHVVGQLRLHLGIGRNPFITIVLLLLPLAVWGLFLGKPVLDMLMESVDY